VNRPRSFVWADIHLPAVVYEYPARRLVDDVREVLAGVGIAAQVVDEDVALVSAMRLLRALGVDPTEEEGDDGAGAVA